MRSLYRFLQRNYTINLLGRFCIHGLSLSFERFFVKLKRYWPVSGTVKVNIEGKPIRFFAKGDDALVNKLFYGKKWEESEIRLFKLLSARSKVFYDIGSNIGLYSLVAQSASHHLKSIAFEPNPVNALRLKRNLEINNLEGSVAIEQKAVGEFTGTISLYLPTNNTISDVSSVYQAHTSNFSDFKIGQIEVPMVAIDDYIGEDKPTPDLIKIDVELFEYEVLKGMSNLLENQAPVIICEIFNDKVKRKLNKKLDEVLKPGLTKDIESFLLNKGYKFYLIGHSGLLKVKDLSSNPDISMYMFSKKQLHESFYPKAEFDKVAIELFG